jgi:ribosomal protein L25 (general stress protein Ctc)
MREREIFGKKVKMSGRQVRNIRGKKNARSGRGAGNNMSVVCMGDLEEVDDKFDRDEFDIKVGKKNYRVIIDTTLDKVWCREIDSYDYTGRVLFRNPPIEDDFVKGLMEFANSSPVPERNKLISINKFVREYKEQRLKSKSKAKRRGRKQEDYIKRATIWAIENQLKNESRTKVATRAYQEFSGEAQSESALIASVRNKWRGWRKIYDAKRPPKKDENGKWKKRVSFLVFVKNYFKPA